jgi:hypothetical protein
MLVMTLVGPARAQAQDPGATAYQVTGSAEPGAGQFPVRHDFDFAVPFGKRLVIERISAVLHVPHNSPVGLPQLTTTVVGNEAFVSLPIPIFQTRFQSGVIDDDVYLLFVAPNLYADGPSLKLSFIVDATFKKVFIEPVISGHLVCPLTTLCAPSVSATTKPWEATRSSDDKTVDVPVGVRTRPRFAKPSNSEIVLLTSRQ